MKGFNHNIAFLHQGDSFDKKVFSGIPFHLLKKIGENVHNLKVLTPIKANNNLNKEKLDKLNLLFYLFLLIGVISFLLMFFLSNYIVEIFLGEQFMRALNVLKIWSFSLIMVPLYIFFNNIIIGRKFTKQYLLLTFITSLLSIGLTALLLKLFLFDGAIYSVLLFHIMILVFSLIILLSKRIVSPEQLCSMINPVSFVINFKSLRKRL